MPRSANAHGMPRGPVARAHGMPRYATVCHGKTKVPWARGPVGIISFPWHTVGAPVAYRGRYAHGVFEVQIYRGHAHGFDTSVTPPVYCL